ncbi:MAG TPA: ABC transporter ATP-binding protein [Fluviicola sp.]|nr:ABC transporter ATP-binding protein [Fluviicola sp.]
MEIKKGQVFGILGPNGSGKTTTLAMLLGVLKPTSGSFSWFNNGTEAANRMRIGTLLETPNFYSYLNAYDNLKVVATIKELQNPEQRIIDVLTQVDLLERGKRPFRTYSLGMKQRLAVAAAILSDPEVLVLDEPTNGLDPMGIVEMRELILSIANQGKTIIIASHILDEIEKMCSHVAILKNGNLLSVGSMGEILSQSKKFIIKAKDFSKLLTAVEEDASLKRLVYADETAILIEPLNSIEGDQLNQLFVQKGIYLSEIREYQKSLESIFIETVQA